MNVVPSHTPTLRSTGLLLPQNVLETPIWGPDLRHIDWLPPACSLLGSSLQPGISNSRPFSPWADALSAEPNWPGLFFQIVDMLTRIRATQYPWRVGVGGAQKPKTSHLLGSFSERLPLRHVLELPRCLGFPFSPRETAHVCICDRLGANGQENAKTKAANERAPPGSRIHDRHAESNCTSVC